MRRDSHIRGIRGRKEVEHRHVDLRAPRGGHRHAVRSEPLVGIDMHIYPVCYGVRSMLWREELELRAAAYPRACSFTSERGARLQTYERAEEQGYKTYEREKERLMHVGSPSI